MIHRCSARLGATGLVLGLIALNGCKQVSTSNHYDTDSHSIAREALEDDDRVLDAAYRWMMADVQRKEHTPQIWFVEGLDGKEASEDLVRTLADPDHPVKKRSAAETFLRQRTVHDNTVAIRDRDTGARGVILEARHLERLRPDVVRIEVEAELDAELEGPGSYGSHLILRRVEARWIVDSVEDVFIGIASASGVSGGTAACRFLLHELKKSMPSWKNEIYADGEEWIGERS